jgi:hypothetical protein
MIDKIIPILTKDKKLIITWTVISALIAGNWLAPVLDTLLPAIPQLTRLILAKVATTLMLISIGLFLSIFIILKKLNKEPDFSKYVHSPKDQCWINPDNETDRICPRCKLDNIMSPLYVDDNHWCCPKTEHGCFGSGVIFGTKTPIYNRYK